MEKSRDSYSIFLHSLIVSAYIAVCYYFCVLSTLIRKEYWSYLLSWLELTYIDKRWKAQSKDNSSHDILAYPTPEKTPLLVHPQKRPSSIDIQGTIIRPTDKAKTTYHWATLSNLSWLPIDSRHFNAGNILLTNNQNYFYTCINIYGLEDLYLCNSKVHLPHVILADFGCPV